MNWYGRRSRTANWLMRFVLSSCLISLIPSSLSWGTEKSLPLKKGVETPYAGFLVPRRFFSNATLCFKNQRINTEEMDRALKAEAEAVYDAQLARKNTRIWRLVAIGAMSFSLGFVTVGITRR